MFRGALLKINVTKENIVITNESSKELTLSVYGNDYTIKDKETLSIA
jgi:maltose phosphorylase